MKDSGKSGHDPCCASLRDLDCIGFSGDHSVNIKNIQTRGKPASVAATLQHIVEVRYKVGVDVQWYCVMSV